MCSVEKLLIKGIRSFSPENDHAIVFPKPLTLIVGRNGAGKTVRISSRERLLEMRGRERGAQNFPFAFAEVPRPSASLARPGALVSPPAAGIFARD